MTRLRFSLLVGSMLVALLIPGLTADEQLIPAGSVWRYNDSGSNLSTSWRATAYNDASWFTGSAQLGYGDGDESTLISYGTSTSNRRITYYFRKQFTVPNPAALDALTLRYLRDDGAVIYLNGTEIARSNMPTGTIGYTTRATVAIDNADESAWQVLPVDPFLLVSGTNVIAVEIHQQSPSSDDVSFDLELTSTLAPPAPPSVTLVSPANSGSSNSTTVTFTSSLNAAASLESASLYVGPPPKSVIFKGPIQVEDAQISADTADTANGTGQTINVDSNVPHVHSLLKFPTLVGSSTGQVPAGAIITAAVLQLNCTNAGNTMRMYRLTESWTENEATWNQRSAGQPWGSPGADGASNSGTFLNAACTSTGLRSIDVTEIVQDWSDGAPNYGVVLTDTGGDGLQFSSSESASSPALTVTFRAGQTPVATQTVSGTSAQVSFTVSLALGSYAWNVRVTDTLGRQSWAATDFALSVEGSLPDEPTLISPLDGSTGVPTTTAFTAHVANPDGGPLTARLFLRQPVGEEFTIIVLPDTQYYSQKYPAIFTSQTQWIADQREARNIVFVTHEGDVVQNASNAAEWQRADTSMSVLEAANIPFGLGPGNHDQPTTLYNQHFGYTRFLGRPYYGGHYQDKNDNNYQLFSGGGLDFVILHLDYCPPAAAVAWGSSVLAAHPDRIGIMTTHAYLNQSAQRAAGSCSNTQYLWDQLAVPNANLRFMLSGHISAESRRTDTIGNRTVFQMLADYQERASGGGGFLRILRFVPAEDTVYVQTYSPWLNAFETDANSSFTLDFPMDGSFQDVGMVTVPSGSDAVITPNHLEPFTRYEWRMTVTNSSGRSRTGPNWTFTTGPGDGNQAPTAVAQSVNALEDTSTLLTLEGTDPEGNPLTYTVVTAPAHGTLSGSAPTLTYQPAPNYNGIDSFTFRVNDGRLNSDAATVSITVQPDNDSPVAVNDAYSVQSGATLTVSGTGVLANDSDVDGGSLTTGPWTLPSHGALTLNANGSFSYTPSSGYTGTDAFTYAASDGTLNSSMATVSLTVTPADGAGNLKAITFEGGSITDPATGADSVIGTVALETSVPIKESVAARISAGSSYLQEDFNATADLYLSFYLRLNARPSGDAHLVRILNGSSLVGTILLRTDGRLRLRNNSSTIGSDSAALSVGQIYRIGIHQRASAGGNTARLEGFLASGDGDFPAPFASTATGTWTSSATQLRLGSVTSVAVNLVLDDIKLDRTSMPGPSGDQTPPAAPTGLSATAPTSAAVELTWTDASTLETAFRIERAGSDNVYTEIGSVASNVTNYDDTTVAASTAYSYRVRASRGSSFSEYSNVAGATTPAAPPPTPPDAPTTLSASAPSSGEVQLTWTDVAMNETAFYIERADSGSGFLQIATTGANATSYSDGTVAGGTAYSYRVRAGNADGMSAYSNTADIATPPSSGPADIKAITFEAGSLTNPTTGADSVTGTVTLESATPLKGLYSARVNGQSSFLQEGFTAAVDLYVSFYVRFNALPSGDVRLALISNAGASLGNLLVRSTGELRLRADGTTIGTASQPLVAGQLYRLGIHQRRGTGGNAVLEAFVASGSAPFGAPFASTTTGTWTTLGDRLRLGTTTSTTVNLLIDDARINIGAMPNP